MAARDDCIDEILKSIKDRRDRKFVREHLEELDARAEADAGAGSYREALQRAVREMLEEEAARSAIRRREVQIHALKLRDGRNLLTAAHEQGVSYRKGLEAILHGVNEQFFDPKSRRGNRRSAEAIGLGAQRAWIADGFIGDLERIGRSDPKFAGLDALYFSRQHEDAIFIEKAELEAGAGGRPGRTKDPAALKIAEVMVKWDKVEIDALNREGAWITPRQRHVAELHHDPDRLRRAAKPFNALDPRTYVYRGFNQADREAWVAKTLQWIDAKKMFGAQAGEADQLLSKMYGGIVAGDRLEMTTVTSEPHFPNIAASVSVQRGFVFKSPEAQLAYIKEFGRFNPTDQWIHTKRLAANRLGLMKVLGPKPKEAFEELIAWAKNSTLGEPEKAELRAWAPDQGDGRLRHRYAVVSGEADQPIANMMTGLVVADMAVQRISKLGSAVFAMLADNATISRELARQGLTVAERYSSILSGYFRGHDETTQRQAARLLATGILGRLRGAAARFDVRDAQAGVMAKLDHTFFKISGFTAITENKRADAERMMALHMGDQRGKAYEALGDAEKRTLQAFGIGDQEWALLHKAEWSKIGDDLYLTPDVARRIPDAAISEYLKGRGSISERALNAAADGDGSAGAIAQARQELALNLWAYYADRGQHAVIEVGAREKAILYRGTQSGDALNLALRLLLQFKQFPTAMLTRAWGAEIYGGGSRMGKLAGLTELIVVSTFFGILTNVLNDIIKGQDPTSRWRNKPIGSLASAFVRGGGGSIYGDFLLGEFSRHGHTASQALIGPTFGQLDQILEIYSDLTHMKARTATAALATRFARNNAPFMNMVYTKTGFDFLLYYKLLEAINPGYLRRMEQTMKQKSGIEFWLRPSQVSR